MTIKTDVQKPFWATLAITSVNMGPGIKAPLKATIRDPKNI